MYTDYKAQRPPMPDAMKLAIPKIQQLLQVCYSDYTSCVQIQILKNDVLDLHLKKKKM